MNAEGRFGVQFTRPGDNLFDIATSHPGVVVSLILPFGVEVTSANAASLGYAFLLQTDQDNSIEDGSSIFSLPGTHTIIGTGWGTIRRLRSLGQCQGGECNFRDYGDYFASSTVKAGALTDASSYKLADTVVLSGLVFDGNRPISGAAITAVVRAPMALSTQTSVGNYQLVSQQIVDANPHLL